MILATTSQSITVVLGEAKTTNNCDITAAYSDVTSSTYQDGANDTTTNGTSSVALVAAPASSTARRVRELTLYNNDTVSHTVTFNYVDGANSRIIWSGTVVAQQLLFFGAENGWNTGLNASFANPSASVGLSTVNGSATTAMRSDGAPALSQAIVPTWTGTHTFNNATYSALFTGGSVGIGTTSPQNILDIGGGVLGAISGNAITLSNSSGNSVLTVGQSSTARGITAWVYNATAGSAYFNIATYGGTNPIALNPVGGNVGIGTTSPASLLDVYGAINISGTPTILANRTIASAKFTVATLPTPVAGLRAIVTDSTAAASGNFGAAPTGSGAHTVPVFCNETPAWLIG